MELNPVAPWYTADFFGCKSHAFLMDIGNHYHVNRSEIMIDKIFDFKFALGLNAMQPLCRVCLCVIMLQLRSDITDSDIFR